MNVLFEKLLKILSLEKEQGFQDHAVIGGLRRFLVVWRDTSPADAQTPEDRALVEQVYGMLADYHELSPQDRAQVVSAVIAKLGKPGPVEAPPPPPAREPRPAPAPRAREPESRWEADLPIEKVKGISEIYGKRMAKLGVRTAKDLLYLFPRRYDDFSALKRINELQYGEEVTIVGTIWETRSRPTKQGRGMIQTMISDGTGMIQATWFNQPFLEKQLRPGREIVLSGKVEEFLGRLTFSGPEWEPLQKTQLHTARLVPVYPLTSGIKQRWLRRTMRTVIDEWVRRLADPLPSALRLNSNLLDLKTSIEQIHFPDSKEMLERARQRLCFEEFLLIQLGVLKQRQAWQKRPGQPLPVDTALVQAMTAALPFALTGAQQRALQDILADLQENHPMSRLLQGDVGSGKTVVTVIAMLIAVANGMQAAIMAPTEILAEQHFRSVSRILQQMSARAADPEQAALLQNLTQRTHLRLLTGSTPRQEKETIYREIESGEANLVIGTHALIQEGVRFPRLAVAVIDEQHRFGVEQRAALSPQEYNPHVLVMSATPIPRTLALTIYGDLDISVIDELPPNRQTIQTRWLFPAERERAYAFVKSQIEQGRQAFIICPLVEESDKTEAKAATSEHERLQNDIFPRLKLGLLHGRMKGSEKEAVMAAFERGDYHILVSTAVVEVGIDVPNATVMLVEGANRFGLAQLHQFRGRVGRGEHQSYCILLSDTPTVAGEQRLKIIESTHDGFALAEEDLKMRGPGEFFGTRQSGLPDLRVAKLSDTKILESARQVAAELFEQDPALQQPEHELLRAELERFWQPAEEPN